MNPDNTTPSPSTPPTAGDEAALKAIEALETESNAIPGAESTTPTNGMSAQTPTAPINPSFTPPMNGPIITEPLVQTTPVSLDSSPVTTDSAPMTPNPLTESLRDDVPAATTPNDTFQPFAKPKKSKKGIIILVVILVLTLLGAGGYFGWQYLQSQNTLAPAITVPETAETTTPTDTEGDVNTSITDIEARLSVLDDSEYEGATLSDATLYN
jgi:hypothetical protein